MVFNKIKSYAKINLALNVNGKKSSLHKIESIVVFASLFDEIFIRKIKSKKHKISFFGDFSRNIGKKNTISKLLNILEKKNLLQNQKFMIQVNKRIPIKAGLGGGSMNAASVLKYMVDKRIIKTTKRKTIEICKLVGSDVVFGLNFTNSILTSKDKIRYFNKYESFYILIVKPNFGCDTKNIYSKVKKFYKPYFNRPSKEMFSINFLKKTTNQLEPIVFSKYPKLKSIKLYLVNSCKPLLVRMTGSGSALVAYYKSNEKCKNAKKKFMKKYKNYWCIASKTI